MQVTTENKVVPKLRFGEFVSEWKTNSFGGLLKCSRLGGNYANSENPTENPLIKMGNLGRGNISLNKVLYIEQGETLDNKDLIEYGDLFFNTRNTLDLVGKVAIWKNELSRAFYNSNLMYIKFDNNFFMNYRLNSFEGIKGLRRLATGTTSVAAIYTRDLLKLKLIVPSLPEQKKIASFLSAVDDKLQQLAKKKDLLEEYKKGVMQQIFSQELRFKDDNGNSHPNWKEKKITEIAKTSIGLVTSMTKHYVELGTPLIRNSDILQNKIKKDKLIYLNKEFDEDNRGRRLLLNDIVTVHTGDIGVSAVIESDLDGCQGFATLNTRIKNQDVICSAYLCWYYNSVKNIRYAISMATGDGRSNYNLKDFNKAIIPIPCIEEQQKISNFLSSLDSKIDLVSNQIENTKAFKKGLLQQMFV